MDGEDKLGDDGKQANDSMDGESELRDVNEIINSLMEGEVSRDDEDDLTVAKYDNLQQPVTNCLANLEVEEFTMNNIASTIFLSTDKILQEIGKELCQAIGNCGKSSKA
eukprot:13012979-Ditylum_brightwellii.AAC.1